MKPRLSKSSQQHLDDRWRELVASGTDPDAAGEVALAELHADALTRYLSPLRQARWTDPAPPAAGRPFSREGLMLDLRQAVRALRATPGFTIAALVVLALGIGATTAIFSVVDAVVLRPLPFDEPDQIVAVGERLRTPMGAPKGSPSGPPSKSGPGGLGPVGKGAPAGKSVPVGMPVPPGMDARDPQALNRMQPQNFLDLTAQQASFESMAAIADAEMALQLPGSVPEDVTAERVSAGFFDVLRIRPAAGRVFTAENENDGRDRVAIVSDVFWRQRLGGTDDVIGRTIRLDGDNYEVIGILPPHVTYPVGAVRPAELLVPYVVPENERTRGRGISIYLHSIARLKPGVTLAQAQSELDRIADAIAAANPGERRLNQFGVRPLHDHLVGASIRSWMVMLLAAVGIVLLIACANVANLLLARASAREREVAVRAALGAGRWRLVRQFLVESLVLAVVGTALGVIVAWWVVQALRGAMPEGVPRAMDIALDLRVLIAAVAVSAMTGLLFGIVPALQLSRPNLTEALSDGTRSASAGRGRQRLRAALVISEVALAVVLLVGAGLFIGSFISVMRVDPGFSSDRVITMQLYARSQEGQRPPDWSGAFEQIVERLNHTSGIVRAGAVSPGIPLRVNLHIDGLARPGRQLEGDTSISLKAVTPGYHQSLSIPLKSGRLFDATDRAESAKVVILNESAARTFFPDEDPVGTYRHPQPRRAHGGWRCGRRAAVEPRDRATDRSLSADGPGWQRVGLPRRPLDRRSATPAARDQDRGGFRAAGRPAALRRHDGEPGGAADRRTPAQHADARTVRAVGAGDFGRRRLRCDGVCRSATHPRNRCPDGFGCDANARRHHDPDERRAVGHYRPRHRRNRRMVPERVGTRVSLWPRANRRARFCRRGGHARDRGAYRECDSGTPRRQRRSIGRSAGRVICGGVPYCERPTLTSSDS